MSPSRYSMYFFESYSSSAMEWSEELCSRFASLPEPRSPSSYDLRERLRWLSMKEALSSRSFLLSSDCSVSFYRSRSSSAGLSLLLSEMILMISFHFCSSSILIRFTAYSYSEEPLTSSYRLEMCRTLLPSMPSG